MTHTSSTLSRIAQWVTLTILAVLPLVFLPITQDFYDSAKWTLLAGGSLFLLLTYAWSILRTQDIGFHPRPSTVGLMAITLASLVSLLAGSTNRIEALLHPFGPVTFAALTIISLLSPLFWDERASRRFLWTFFGTASVLALIALYQFFGVGKTMFPNTAFLADPLWTPTGSSTATVAILALVFPLLLKGMAEARKHGQEALIGILALMTVVVTAGFGVMVWQIVPKLSTILLSPREGWVVLLEILKAPRQAIAGVGAENFLTAFTAGRPARLNLTPLWNARFLTNANLLFHLSTIYGLLGAASAVLFLKNFIARKHKDALFASLALGLLFLLLVPPNLSLLVVLTGILLVSESQGILPETHRKIPGWAGGIIFTLCLLLVAGGYYLVGRSYMAEVYFSRALAAAQKNDGRGTYNLQIQAIQLNPKISRFHITYSQINLALAVSVSKTIAEQSEASKEDQEQNRKLVSQLIQQAIAEGKTAVNLNPSNILAWENLARTYQQLIGVAQGADTWAVTTYSQAIRLDPYNPLLSLELGGVYVQMKNYTLAITQFIRATNLKPDYANAWYNLANAYRIKGDREEAMKALEKTLTLLTPDSNDYRIVSQLLEEASSTGRANQESPPQDTPVETLTTPAPTPVIVPPLELPNE